MVIRVTSRTFCNDLKISECPTSVTYCKVCHVRILQGELRVAFCRFNFSAYYYHLDCFTPLTHVRIHLAHCVIQVSDSYALREVHAWVTQWNAQFQVNSAQLAVYRRKSVTGKPDWLRRPLIEVFRYLDTHSLVCAAGVISKSWYEVAWEDEIWLKYMDSSALPAGNTLRGEYITAFFSRCMHCNELTPEPHMICPLFHRPKCFECYKNKSFRPLRLRWAKSEYHLSKGLIRRLGLKVFEFDCKKCIYLYLSNAAIGSFRYQLVQFIADNAGEKDLEAELRGVKPQDLHPEAIYTRSTAIQRLIRHPKAQFYLKSVISAQSYDEVLSLFPTSEGRNRC